MVLWKDQVEGEQRLRVFSQEWLNLRAQNLQALALPKRGGSLHQSSHGVWT